MDKRLEAAASALRRGLPDPRRDAAQAIKKELNRAVVLGSMPSFEDATIRSSYIADRLMTRTTNVCNVLLLPEMHDVLVHLFHGRQGPLRAASLGGGPGFDALGLAKLASICFPSVSVDCAVLDYEDGWRSSVDALNEEGVLGAGHRATFGTCDITLPLAADAVGAASAGAGAGANGAAGGNTGISNRHTAQPAVTRADLVIFAFVCHENASKLRERDLVFLRDCFAAAPLGAIFVFLDSMHALWPEVAAAAGPTFEARFAYHYRCHNTLILWKGKNGSASQAGEASAGQFGVTARPYGWKDEHHEGHLRRMEREGAADRQQTTARVDGGSDGKTTDAEEEEEEEEEEEDDLAGSFAGLFGNG
eukprot:g4164.t1